MEGDPAGQIAWFGSLQADFAKSWRLSGRLYSKLRTARSGGSTGLFDVHNRVQQLPTKPVEHYVPTALKGEPRWAMADPTAACQPLLPVAIKLKRHAVRAIRLVDGRPAVFSACHEVRSQSSRDVLGAVGKAHQWAKTIGRKQADKIERGRIRLEV